MQLDTHRSLLLNIGAAGLLLTAWCAPLRGVSAYTLAPIPAGGTVSVSIGEKYYPRNALVRVTLQFTNESSAPLEVLRQCPVGSIGVQVLGQNGAVRYPPLFAEGDGPTVPCKVGLTRRVLPGHRLTEHARVILRGPKLRAFVSIVRQPANRTLYSRVVTVVLASGGRPRVRIHSQPDLYAEVRGTGDNQSGPIWYQDTELCPVSDPAGAITSDGAGTAAWQRLGAKGTRAYRFEPTCAAPIQWHVIAGWPNEPVAAIDYPSRTEGNGSTRLSLGRWG